MTTDSACAAVRALLCAAIAIATLPAIAFQQRTVPSRFDALGIEDPTVAAAASTLSVSSLPPGDPVRQKWESFKRSYGAGWEIYLDGRSGAPMLVQGQGIPWIAGSGNSLEDAAPVTVESLESRIRDFMASHTLLFVAKDAEMVLRRSASSTLTPETWQITFDHVVGGVPVIGDRYTFYIGHGNLIAFGATRWTPVGSSPVPSLSATDALRALYRYMGLVGSTGVTTIDEGTLEFAPLAPAGSAWSAWRGEVGTGYDAALVWHFAVRVAGEPGTWSALVDARTGAVLSFFDDDRYAQVKGGVYQTSDDQICPDGCEQPGFPMPFADITINGAGQNANSLGNFTCSPPGGIATTHLAGPYVRVNDTCGAVSESITCDEDLDLATGLGNDCTVPSGHSVGDTHSSRTGFYHLNRIAEHGRSWLPGNTWLTQQLTDNVDLNSTCNAFWDGASVNFYKSGGGCNNTGEIAGVFLHEWGHGLDNNDGGGYDNPSEAYADITSLMRTHVSCIGRGFYQSGQCGGYGNACLSCTGIRDDDWNQRVNHTPSTPGGFVQSNCSGGSGPCGREVHCEGYVGGETLWDLANRDLPPLGLDQSTSWQLADRLWYQSRNGSGGNAYNCSLPNSDGCSATSWFTKLRTADDDDGNLNNGTPHAAAIFGAFNRHLIACGAASDASNTNSSTCPSIGAATLSVSAGSGAANLSWTAVPNASKYYVLRNDYSCSYGSTIAATVTGTSYTDTGLANGFSEYYTVQAVGANSACEGKLSNCQPVTPQPFAGTIGFSRASYGCSSLITVIVTDGNIGASTTTATIWSSTEPTPQTITLTQIGPGNPKYQGTIQATANAPANDGMLSIHDGDTISAQYIDADDGQGGHNLTRSTTALADCVGPAISGVGSSGVTDHNATVSWTTDQAADTVLTYGVSPPPTTNVTSSALSTQHVTNLSNLQQCTVYYYQAQSSDPAGNTTIANNGGAYFTFETLGNFGSGLQSCHLGRLSIDRSVYSCSDAVQVTVIDIDLNRNPLVAETVTVQVTSTTEPTPELLVLTETGPSTATFVGTIPTDGGAVAHDGKIQVRAGDRITATYHDANDGTGKPAVVFQTSSGCDCTGPVISALQGVDLVPGRVEIDWSTDEPATTRVDYGTTPALGSTLADQALVLNHTQTINGLTLCATVYFKVTSADSHNNTTTDDRGGLKYTFETGDIGGRVFYDGFETNTGWTLEGEWQIGTPMGLGGSGSPTGRGKDPTSAWSGSKVLGDDLTGLGTFPGDYEPNQNIRATSPTIDGTNLHNARLIFQRWLNTQAFLSDRAKIWVKVGSTLNQVYQNPNSLTEDSFWNQQTIDISAFADTKTFQIVFGQQSDLANQEGGWNIDDLVVKDGTQPASKTCGGCTTKPSFAGLGSAADVFACGDSGISLSWPPAVSWGSGGSGTYSVYRDTTPNFTPGAGNRIASGLTTTTYADAAAPNGVTLYYLVRAENSETCSNGPNNNGVQDDNAVYRSSQDSVSQPIPADLGGSVRVTTVAGTHVRVSWSPASGATSYHVYRADNPQMFGISLIGTTSSSFFDDIGEATGSVSRYYLVRGVNSCGAEGP